MAQRIAASRTLAQTLPSGAEGGKEFARVVDLLLFHDARRRGESVTLLNDAAGDYAALDSVGHSLVIGDTGYQYKFYPSPLSNDHRDRIKASLKAAAAGAAKSKIKRWILVTPEDLVESAKRKSGGDVSWFVGLKRQVAKQKIVLEHWGHKQLQALFAQTPSIALFYYPSLVPDSLARTKTLAEVLARYQANLLTAYGKIQFVGMSVYKPEATKGIALGEIYIPLALVAEEAEDDEAATARVNALRALAPSACHVVLGDPGSGKSTLLRFLALSGKSEQLQSRFDAAADPDRIPILVTLRRYADELKSRPMLSLFDYIVEVTQADFSLKAADARFFEAYLDAGRAILCFDGLDELPNPQFKTIVRDRITALLDSYPGNTCIVTSRIVGYETSFRFDDRFTHYKVGKLQLPEIEQFVADWYAVREEDSKTRDDNVAALIRVIRDPDHDAIRTLARNPLLLTIIALVHRIDADLPDERVVLYTKCTETLLNTWHKWKFRDTEESVSRAKIERRNKLRVEAVAHWMQTLSVGAEQRAVVSAADLESYLTSYIEQAEKPVSPDSDARQLAVNFLDFVRQRAGLLIEVGDQRYSFVHLTFQEYLAASHIVTATESGGAEAKWEAIQDKTSTDRWQETIRLFVASLRSSVTRGFIVDAMIRQCERQRSASRAVLLLGLLLDGIDEAEERAADIVRLAIAAIAESKDADEILRVIARTRSALKRIRASIGAEVVLDQICEKVGTDVRRAVMVAAAATGLASSQWLEKQGESLAWFRLLLPETGQISVRAASVSSPLFRTAIASMLRLNPSTNAAASAGIVLGLAVDPNGALPLLSASLMLNGLSAPIGPYHDECRNITALILPHLLPEELEQRRQPFGGRGGAEHKLQTVQDLVRERMRLSWRKQDVHLEDNDFGAALRDVQPVTLINVQTMRKLWASLWVTPANLKEFVSWFVEVAALRPVPQWSASLRLLLPDIDLTILLDDFRREALGALQAEGVISNANLCVIYWFLDTWCRLFAGASLSAELMTRLKTSANRPGAEPMEVVAKAFHDAIGDSNVGLLRRTLADPRLGSFLDEIARDHGFQWTIDPSKVVDDLGPRKRKTPAKSQQRS